MTRVRNLQPGQHFILKRTGERYRFIGRRHESPKGTEYVVLRSGFAKPTTLHHSCHVEPLEIRP